MEVIADRSAAAGLIDVSWPKVWLKGSRFLARSGMLVNEKEPPVSGAGLVRVAEFWGKEKPSRCRSYARVSVAPRGVDPLTFRFSVESLR